MHSCVSHCYPPCQYSSLHIFYTYILPLFPSVSHSLSLFVSVTLSLRVSSRSLSLCTFKVHLSVPVEVHVPQDLVDLVVVQLLSHQLLHGLPQLPQADLPVAIRVKLGEARMAKTERLVCRGQYWGLRLPMLKGTEISTSNVADNIYQRLVIWV